LFALVRGLAGRVPGAPGRFGLRNAENSTFGRRREVYDGVDSPWLEANMSKKQQGKDGELSEQQLDRISGGHEEVRKMGTIEVTAKRLHPEPQPKVVKMETITVTAQRDKPETTTRLAGVTGGQKK
jgi:hypothetical protein